MATDTDLSPQQLSDEQQILALIGRWSKAVRDENRAAIRADHDSDILMFDVPLPLQSQRLDASMTTWTGLESAISAVTADTLPAVTFRRCGLHAKLKVLQPKFRGRIGFDVGQA